MTPPVFRKRCRDKRKKGVKTWKEAKKKLERGKDNEEKVLGRNYKAAHAFAIKNLEVPCKQLKTVSRSFQVGGSIQ